MILFPSNYLGDIEQFHNFAEYHQRNHSEDRQNKKLKNGWKMNRKSDQRKPYHLIFQVMNMKYIIIILFAFFALCGCYNYHKLDFYASNQGFSYLDSLKKNNKCVALPYPYDAFCAAKPFFLKKYGAKGYRIRKPYHVILVNDSTWEVWTDGDFCRYLNRSNRYTIGWSGIGISMFDGRILYLKHNR